MWEWLFGPKFERRPLSEPEEEFVRRLLRGDSPQLRALRAQLDSLKETGTSIAVGKQSLNIQFSHSFPHLWLPDLEPIHIRRNVQVAAEEVTVSLSVEGGLKEIVVSAVNAAAFQDLESLLSKVDLEPINDARLGPPDEFIRRGWETTFGDYLQRELSIFDQETGSREHLERPGHVERRHAVEDQDADLPAIHSFSAQSLPPFHSQVSWPSK